MCQYIWGKSDCSSGLGGVRRPQSTYGRVVDIGEELGRPWVWTVDATLQLAELAVTEGPTAYLTLVRQVGQ